MAENILSEVEHVFTPKPGGMIDRHRQHEAQREAAATERANLEHSPAEPAYKAVKTAPESPETIFFITYLIQPGARQQLLPYNPYRQRATISITTPSAFGLICRDEPSCVSQVGFFHGVAQPPLVIMSRAQVWFYNAGSVAANVSIMSENYAAVTPGF